MRQILSILLFSTTLIGMQACVSDREKKESNETADVKAPETLAERRAKLEVQRVDRMEKKIAYLEACVKAGPTYTNKAGKLVYYQADVDPAFIGGEKALATYMHDNLVYPQDAEKEGLEGTVFVDFIVMPNGSVNEIEVMNEFNDNIDQRFIDEAVRVIVNMPNWTPGQQNGKAVAVKFSVPVTFQMI